MFSTTESWFQWALLSAVFAAMTAILAKIGLAGIDSDFATLVRTVVILVALAAFVLCTGKWSNPLALAPKPLLFLTLSGLATGASWVCYFRALKAGDAAKVAPVDKLSLLLVAVFAVVFLKERLNVRELDATHVPEAVDLIVCDVSFIGLRLALPAALALAAPDTDLVALIKPQFEVGPSGVGKGGIVRDAALRQQACDTIRDWLAAQPDWTVRGIIDSPIEGGDGNREFLIAAAKS